MSGDKSKAGEGGGVHKGMIRGEMKEEREGREREGREEKGGKGRGEEGKIFSYFSFSFVFFFLIGGSKINQSGYSILEI